jgi:hypothetical protein
MGQSVLPPNSTDFVLDSALEVAEFTEDFMERAGLKAQLLDGVMRHASGLQKAAAQPPDLMERRARG